MNSGRILVRHVGALAVELLDGIGDGGDFDGAETFDQGIARRGLRVRPAHQQKGGNGDERNG